MSRLRLLLLLFLPIFSCLDVVNIAFTPERDCKESSSLVNNTWGAHIMTTVGDPKYYEAAFISPIHILTTKHAVMRNENGKEVMRERREIVALQWADKSIVHKIKNVLVPVEEYDEESNEMSFGDLAIVQVEEPVRRYEAFSPICPPGSSDVDPELNVNAFFLLGYGVEKRLIPYNYSKGAKYITTDDNIAEEFYTAILTDDFERVIGLKVNETTAINIRYWEEFICEHTGICMKGNRMQNWQKDIASHYMENGRIFPVSPCSHSYYVNLMKNTTPFTRLNRQEARDLRSTCGRSAADLDFSFIVTISAENECDSGNCTVISANCTGTLISQRHVITSADCIRSLNEYANKWKTTVYFTDGKELQPGEIFHPNVIFSLSAWTKVRSVVIPPIAFSNLSYAEWPITNNIALLELDEPIPINSYTKPICIAHSSDSLPDKLTVTYLAETTHDKYEVRYRQTRKIVDKESEESSFIEWDYELRRVEEISPKNYSKECQYLELNYPADISFGSPIVAPSKDRWTLYAVTTSLNGLPNQAMRPSYFSTFICIHTGICEDGETFTQRTLMPSSLGDPNTPPSVIWREMLKFREESNGTTSWQAAMLRNHNIWKGIDELNLLTDEEYATTREECGKTTKNLPFVVPFGEVGWFPHLVPPVTRHYEYGRGVFISRRHILTSRSWMGRGRLRWVFFGTNNNDTYPLETSKIDFYEARAIRYFFTPNQDKPASSFEMIILELDDDIEPGVHHQIVCLPDYAEWMEEQAREGPSMLVNSWDTDNEFDSYNLRDTSEFAIHNESEKGHIVYTRMKDRHVSMPKLSDRDSPFIRKFADGDRYYLEGMLSQTFVDSFSLLPATLMYRDICRLTGVCPKPDNRRIANDEHPYFINKGRSKMKGVRLCQPPNY